jgi:Tfp pilus assembly PilM family ATPase
MKKSAVSIDLGSHALKVAEIAVSDTGARLERAVYLERSELVADGWEPGNIEQLARMLAARMGDAKIRTKGVCLGIGGQDCMMRYTRIPPVPAWRLKVIMSYETGEVSEKIGEPLASGYRPLQLVREADDDQTILIGLAKEKQLQALLEALEAAGITVDKAVPMPIALQAAHEAFGDKADPDAPEDDLLLLADLGSENLSIALVLNDKLAFARSISFGGKAFTEALSRAAGVEFDAAEKLKVAKGGLDEREKGVHPDTVMPLRTVGGQLLGMLQSSIRFASSQIGMPLPAITRVVVSGGGMRLRGLPSFLAQGLGKPVAHFEAKGLVAGAGLSQSAAKALAERPGAFAASLGLGLTGLVANTGDPQKGSLSILPTKYQQRREFKDRTLFLYAAAVLLGLLLFARLGHAIYANVAASSVLKDLTTTHTELEAKKQELDNTRRTADARKARLNRLLKESEQTAFQAFVLDTLSHVLRPEIQIEKVHLAADEGAETGGYDYNLRILGRVNNEKRQGLDWILDLQSTLKAEDRIGSVEEVSSRPDGSWYVFELAIRPNYVRY